MLYPIKFQPIYKTILWGGENIKKRFKRQVNNEKVAESWEICCRNNGMSIVSNGSLEGKSLSEIIDIYKDDLIGSHVYKNSYETFPLLIKIIDANDKLSVQVHPDDEYARIHNGENGKNEMWYIIDAKPGATLIYGLKEGTTKDAFIKSINDKTVKYYLNEMPVAAGDIIYIPAGTVHAILDGILIAEIQQNSDTTFRLYDWDRVDNSGNPRQLHIKQAMDVINFNITSDYSSKLICSEYTKYTIKELTKNKYFSVDEININDTYNDATDGSTFNIYMVLEGSGLIEYSGLHETLNLGETVLIPASLGKYKIDGNLKILKIYI